MLLFFFRFIKAGVEMKLMVEIWVVVVFNDKENYLKFFLLRK